WPRTVSERLRFIPTWDSWSLRQPNANGYTLAKRTAANRPWVPAGSGRRSQGYAYLGDTAGGIGVGLRDFWKLVPTQLDVDGASGDLGTVTVWLYAPSAQPMRSEEHTSELQSRFDLVCRLLLEKKNNMTTSTEAGLTAYK